MQRVRALDAGKSDGRWLSWRHLLDVRYLAVAEAWVSPGSLGTLLAFARFLCYEILVQNEVVVAKFDRVPTGLLQG